MGLHLENEVARRVVKTSTIVFKFECRGDGIHALPGYYMVQSVNEDHMNGLRFKVDIL